MTSALQQAVGTGQLFLEVQENVSAEGREEDLMLWADTGN